MERLLIFAAVGLAAQLVDGALGMAYGVTSTTLLLSSGGVGPAVASASVHLSEVGTTLVSGLSHWRFGNVDWAVVARIALPGAVGGFSARRCSRTSPPRLQCRGWRSCSSCSASTSSRGSSSASHR